MGNRLIPEVRRRTLAAPALASIAALAALSGDAEAARRQAALEARVRVIGICQAVTGPATVALDASCTAAAGPATLVESGAVASRGTAAPVAAGVAVPIAGAVEADGIQYLTVIY
jgi:hypothetical protein